MPTEQGSDAPLSPRQEELKRSFEASRGYWADYYDGLLRLDPDFFEIFLAFSAHPWKKGVIEPKVKELIYIAIDAATTHLYEPGLRIHIRNALDHGASVAEILEVYELVSVLGMHSITMGLPALLEEAQASSSATNEEAS